jgi:vitamin B12 transporter
MFNRTAVRNFIDFEEITRIFAGLALAVFLFVPQVFAQSQEELDLLKLYYRDKDLVFTPTRTLQPVSRTAENVTIVTAEEIEKMNAHTLSDVLNTVPGLQVQVRGGPGMASSLAIQGSETYHVLTLIDGMKLNTLADNVADVGNMPVQMIERVEILKGPGSSTWGSSLGGVINIITKSPDSARPFGGSASASYGERRTGDYRAETTGTVGRLGYYVYGGYLTTGGFAPQTSVYENNAYSKFVWSLPNGSVTWAGGYIRSSRGDGQFPAWDQSTSTRIENMFSTLSFNCSPIDDLDVNVSLHAINNRLRTVVEAIGSPASESSAFNDHTIGGSAKVVYRYGIHGLTLGTDYDDGKADGSMIGGEHGFRTLAFFGNDVITIGKLSVIPGIRYDHSNTNGGFVSPSLGVAYNIGDTTTLRAYGARGFNVPRLSSMYSTAAGFIPNPDLEVEKVNSVQVGLESFALKYFWLKTTLFRHDLSDTISVVSLPAGSYTVVNAGRQRRQGIEVEVKTKPIHRFSVSAGTTYLDSRNRETDERLVNSPRYTYDIGVEYNNDKLFYALLKGHFIKIHSDRGLQSKDSTFVWDIHASRTIFRTEATVAQLFFSVHNLFNASQFLVLQWPNPARWAEVGLRVKF